MGVAAVTDDAVLPVFYAVSVASLVVAWALVRLAQRCGVSPQFALWLGVLSR